MKSFVGSDKPYVLAGFDIINPGAAIGTQNVSVKVADSIVYYPESLAGPFFHGLEEGNTLSTPLVPELRKNSTNYIYLTLTTSEAAKDTRAFWDPDKEGGDGGEFTQDINTQTALISAINVSTSSFPEDTVPIAIVEVGPNFITSIEDARDMMFRLGTGGLSPDPLSTYAFRQDPAAANARLEPNTLMTNALDPNAFQGGDKNILSLKEWMDVVMTKLKELSGTTYWYEDTSTFSLVNIFKDILSTSIKSKGVWQSSDSTAGLLTWTEDILIQSVSDNKDIIVRDSNKTLVNDQTMYIPLIRRADINTGAVSVNWFNALNYVNGTLGSFENLTKGDWIKKSDDPDYRYLRVEEFYAAVNLGGGVTSPGNALSIKLSDTYGGISELKRGVYNKGVYLSGDVLVADRDTPALSDIGGDLYWLAMRSDTIMSVADLTTTTLSIDITNHDGVTAKVTSAAHGLTDKQKIGITGTTNFDGTYAVQVEDVNTFYIDLTGGPHADELTQSAYYTTITTQARTTADLLQLESANHGFDIDQQIIIAGTTNYNGSYEVFPTGNTTFTVPVNTAIANETAGTATAVIVYVRTDIGPTRLDQGENKQIGEVESENIMSFIGMDNASQTYPSYHTPPDYNTIDGFQNYNSDITDNLTQRVSKLTAMMADKAQDKTIILAPSGYTTVNNVLNGTARDISFTPAPSDTPFLDIILPSSDQNNDLTLSGTISLETNEAAYITIDRNNSQSIANLAAVTIASITSVPLDENVIVLAVRLGTDEVWLWDGFYVSGGITPIPSFLAQVVVQDRNAKMTEGGTWSWNSGTGDLINSADAYIQVAGLTDIRNTVLAQTVNLAADGDVAYVEINRSTGAANNLTVTVAQINSVVASLNTFIIARRIGTDIVLGTSTEKLLNGQSMTLDQTTSDQILTFIGADNTADSDPNYSSDIRGVANESLETRLGVVTDAAGDNQEDRSAFLRSVDNVTWTGTQIEFTTDIVLEVLNTKSGTKTLHNILTAGSPITIADGESIYIEINRTSASESVTAVNSGTTAIPAQVQADKDIFVLFERIDEGGIKNLYMPFNKQVISEGVNFKIGAAGGGGVGNADSIIETLKNRLNDSVFEAVTPNVFRIDEDNLLDGSSTGTYSSINNNFAFAGAAETMVSVQMLDTDFLAATEGINDVELATFWDLANIDTAAVYQVSRNGGNEWQTVTMERVDSSEVYRGYHTFTDEASNQSILTQSTKNTTDELDTTNAQQIGQLFVLANATELREVVLSFAKNGAPDGNIAVSIYDDSAGDPGTQLVESSNIAISSISTGDNTIDIPNVVLAAGTYHIVVRTDAAYKATFVTTTKSLVLDGNSAGTDGETHNGTVWAAAAYDLAYIVKGIELDLRVRITSSTAANLEGYGIFYDKAVGNIATGILNRQVFHFQAVADNDNEFNVTSFIPNADVLNVYYIQAGQVFQHPAFQIDGNTIKFEVDQFNNGGVEAPVTLVFDQTRGGAFDNSDLNGLLLASNFLGSTDGSIDKSSNGRGIFLRRPDGTLREIAIDDSDNIVIYSV